MPDHQSIYSSYETYKDNLSLYIQKEDQVENLHRKYKIFSATLTNTDDGKYSFHVKFELARNLLLGTTFYVHHQEPDLIFKKKDSNWVEFHVEEFGETKGEIIARKIKKENGGIYSHYVCLYPDQQVSIALQSNTLDTDRQYEAVDRFYQECLKGEKSSLNIAIQRAFLGQFNDETGKTSLVEKGKRVLVLAKTNKATDVIALKIAEAGDNPFRLLGKYYYSSAPKEILELSKWENFSIKRRRSKNNQNKKEKEIQTINQNDIEFKWNDITCSQAKVVVTTLSCSANILAGIPNETKFDAIIVDEAGQCLDSYLLIPVMRSYPYYFPSQLMLIGDHQQLSPFLLSGVLRKAKYDVSLMKRSVDLGFTPQFLTIQYRMHPVISKFSSDTFYQGKINDGINSNDRTKVLQYFKWLNPEFPLLFWDVPGQEILENKSFHNIAQTNAGIKCAEKLLKSGIKGNQISIITPYLGEADYIFDHIIGLFDQELRNEANSIKFNTADAFQGFESDYVIYISVRTNKEGDIGFLSDYSRVNVSFTRAKYGLIVIGDAKTFKTNELWSKFITYCRENQSAVEGEIENWKLIQFEPGPFKKKSEDFQDKKVHLEKSIFSKK